MIEAYPLCWPVNYPRAAEQKKSKFKQTLGQARDFVKAEIERIKGTDSIISTNIPVKQNGDLYANWQSYRLDDTGVAVYFTRNKQQVVLCCDTYKYVNENLYAIGRTIEALRQIDRDGVSDFLDRTFTGFKALPETVSENAWRNVLHVSSTADYKEVKLKYLELVRIHHPDHGGDVNTFNTIVEAWKQAEKFFTNGKM